jgi:predicted amidophosphoribosyltransferase
MPSPLRIDPSNRGAHPFLGPEDECYFFHEYTSREGFHHSAANQLIFNLKKSVLLRNEYQYRYKERAIAEAGAMLRAAFESSPWVFTDATFAPIPPSKAEDHPEFDDRMTRILSAACQGKGADVRQILRQVKSYDASHTVASGARMRPNELEALYHLEGTPPKPNVILVDDVLTTGAHFVAARNVIRNAHPGTRIIGMFVARRIFQA